ncbi:hypothetical protein PoB_002650500 [Plakobranchus ocellatus]|uniref:Uncharacterized protein n=1 Tax=Plakobranchus ocellatus TaxID=259542 RepID=A0AAV3ZZA4_9GAST|nr:hypothetical protein PoB_002650500 [Plakobranchus ocellatus]
MSSAQEGDLGLSGPPSGRDADGGARARDRRVPADLRADSLATVPPPQPRQSDKDLQRFDAPAIDVMLS